MAGFGKLASVGVAQLVVLADGAGDCVAGHKNLLHVFTSTKKVRVKDYSIMEAKSTKILKSVLRKRSHLETNVISVGDQKRASSAQRVGQALPSLFFFIIFDNNVIGLNT